MKYEKGDRVTHPNMKDWGLGEVLANSNGDIVKIFFVGAGEKKISLKYVQPIKVAGEKAGHPVLDNLKIKKSSSGIKYQSLSQSMHFFVEQFPEGFYGSKFNEYEREYKDKAHALALELLAKETFVSFLEKEEYTEITKRAQRIVNATNLIFPNEKMALKDGLIEPNAKKEFSQTLFGLLFDEGELKGRFEAFSKVLENINAAKWTTVSYFLFVFLPDKYMFVKPTITQYSAELCGFEINYKPQLNWLTYKSVLDFSNYLFSELSELKPRDMTDVQSFMWCIAPGTYQSA
ncbi:DUF3553 domain-containing protein [Photobacterium sagamiensis]|uniref:DUF3553 domain-containing protein n=1 Tax=Photobacterium sagamiensis TaxID=2910241 RepID=UPI003D125012